MPSFRRWSKLVYLFILFVIVYLYESFSISPNDPSIKRYHLSLTGAILLTLTVVVPYILIWAVALIGYLRFRAYGRSIRSSSDGRAIMQVVYGLFWLVLWLPVSTVLSSVLNDVVSAHPGFGLNAHRITSYVDLIILLIGYILLFIGSTKMLALVKRRLPTRPSMAKPLFCLVYALFSAAYIYGIFQQPTSAGHSVVAYLPDPVLLLTIIVPDLIMWFLGLLAVWQIYLYARYVSGVLYRVAFRYLAIGLAVVTVTYVLLGYLSATSGLTHLGLTQVLELVYALLVILAIGFVVIMAGARRLRRIEEA